MDKQREQSRSSPKRTGGEGQRLGARAAPPRRRGHRQEVGRHAGERGSGQATRAYLGAPTPTTTSGFKQGESLKCLRLALVRGVEVVASQPFDPSSREVTTANGLGSLGRKDGTGDPDRYMREDTLPSWAVCVRLESLIER